MALCLRFGLVSYLAARSIKRITYLSVAQSVRIALHFPCDTKYHDAAFEANCLPGGIPAAVVMFHAQVPRFARIFGMRLQSRTPLVASDDRQTATSRCMADESRSRESDSAERARWRAGIRKATPSWRKYCHLVREPVPGAWRSGVCMFVRADEWVDWEVHCARLLYPERPAVKIGPGPSVIVPKVCGHQFAAIASSERSGRQRVRRGRRAS